MALSSKKITEVEQIEKLLNTEDVYVKQGDTFRRIPLSVFFAELWDGRTDNEGTAYPKIGDYIHFIYAMIDSMSDEALFQPHMRKWADDATKTAVWEVYKFMENQ